MRLWSLSIVVCGLLLASCEPQDETPAAKAQAASGEKPAPVRSTERADSGGESASERATEDKAKPVAPAHTPDRATESAEVEASLEPPPPVSDEGMDALREFADTFVAAVNATDYEKYFGLVHSDCATEITTHNRHFFDELSSKDLTRTVTGDYDWKLTALDPDTVSTFGGMYTYPVIPTHSFTITFLDDLGNLETLHIRVAPDGERMGLVVPIPSDEALSRFNQSESGMRRIKATIDKLLATMDGALLQTVKELLRNGKFKDALDHYCQESGQPRHIGWEVLSRMNVAEQGP